MANHQVARWCMAVALCALAGCATAAPVAPTPSPPEAVASPVPATAEATAIAVGAPDFAGGARNTMNALRPEFRRALIAFALDLLARVGAQDEDENVFISPANIALALAMTANGARGETQRAMLKLLAAEDAMPEQANLDYAALQALLKRADPKVELAIANSLWARAGVPFNADFLQSTRRFFDAQIEELDFMRPDAADVINAWVSENTGGKINGIVSELPDEIVMVLISAIYFNGAWERPFDQARTQDLPFTLLDGTQRNVPTMFQSGLFDYLAGDGFQAVALPYAGGALRMIIFLPDVGSSLARFRESLTRENWEAWRSQFAPKQGQLLLPRFKTEYRIALNEVLQQMGIAIAFDSERADFSAMRPVPPNVFISDVQHMAYVDVNESGTEAAAATSVQMGVTSARPIEDVFVMHVDRPFFFAIEDTGSEALLFAGLIVQP